VRGLHGSDVARKAIEKLAHVWKTRYGIDIGFDFVLSCERNALKREFHSSQFPESFMVKDMKELARDTAFDVTSKEERLLPFFFGLDTGFPCVSRTPQSSKAKDNVNCVQERRSETGIAFGYVEDMIQKHTPVMTLLECVSGLDQLTVNQESSDAAWMVKRFQEKGSCCWFELADAELYGSPAPRERLYWGILNELMDGVDHQEVVYHFLTLFRAFQIPHDLANVLLHYAGRGQARQVRNGAGLANT
jgi:site-specific DNA-cytosine methylase